jgi:dihydrofolate synthase/folylpolyglutamate synthase
LKYDEAMKYIESALKFGSKLGLDRIKRLLGLMGNPEKKIKCIHVAGTNGKGSVVSMIGSILMDSGYRVGMFTSPHLERFSERIKINDDEISDTDVARLITYMAPLVDRVIEEGYDHPTEFEIVTALMFQYFYENDIDFGVIEVGLGGRLDSTNVIEPLVSVITSISYDHMAILGDTLSKIAYEKAGIIKERGIVVSYPQKKEAFDIIKKVCEQRKALLVDLSGSHVNLKEYSMYGQTFDAVLNGETYENLKITLIGEHQLKNAVTAIAAVRALSKKGIIIDKKNIYSGLLNARWNGRLEVMSSRPVVLLDGAHNVEGITSLKEALKKYFKYKNLILVIGILADKQVKEMCSIIMPMAGSIVATTPDSNRALPADKLGKIAKPYCSDVCVCPAIEDAYKCGLDKANEDDLVLFCGSLYMIGHVRTIIVKDFNISKV